MGMKLRLIIGLLIAMVSTIVIYWPGVHGGFVLDDFSNIVQNSALNLRHLSFPALNAAAFSSGSGPLDRPISMLSFALNEYLWGPAPYSMKATNIVIHALNGALIFAVAALILTAYRQRFRPDLSIRLTFNTALAITFAWLLLPINLTAVLYIVQRMVSLSAVFVLSGIALYIWGRLRMQNGGGGYWMLWVSAILCGGLGVLAKEIGALLPIYTLAIEWTIFRFADSNGTRDRRLYLYYLIVLVLPGLFGLLWLRSGIEGAFLHSNRPFTMGERLLTEPRIVLHYIAWSLLPNLHALSLYHDDFPFSTTLLNPLSTLPAILGIAGLSLAAVWQRPRRPLVSLGILWFLGGQLLTATIFNLELVFEHRNYLPDFGLLLCVFSVALLEQPVNRLITARRALVVGLICLYAVILGLRVHQWENPVRYALLAATEHPGSPRATYDLGRTYTTLVNGPNSPFLSRAIKAQEHAAAVQNASILPESALLILSEKVHRPLKPAWWASIERKLSSRSATAQDISALDAMVRCELGSCKFPNREMTAVFKAAFSKSPKSANLMAIYSDYTLNVLHDYALTQHIMQTAVRVAPSQPEYRINLIRLQIYLREFRAAREGIAALNRLNRLGRLDTTVDKLNKRLARAEATSPASTLRLPEATRVEH